MIPSHIPNSALERRELDFSGVKIIADQVEDIEMLWNQLLSLGPEHPWVKDERIPYWAEIWPASIALSQHIVSRSSFFKNKSVLEIGCGLGIPGIVAGKLGAQVTLTDYQQDALDLAAHNWSLNLSEMPVCKQLDWRKPTGDLAADIILASDVAYEKRAFEPLIQAFSTLLKPGGTVFLSEPGRDFAKDFFARLSQQEYEIKEWNIPINWRTTLFKVRVWELTRLKRN